jgi:hypothetical protein
VNKQVLLGISAIVAFTPLTAFAQAAAESALTNALSSSSTIKAGSALNHALNQGGAQLGARIQERTSGPLHLGVQQSTPRSQLRNQARRSQAAGNLRVGSTPGTGAIFIQGGQVACSPSASVSQPSIARTTPGPATTDCRGKALAPNSGNQDKYKSFVTLPPPR